MSPPASLATSSDDAVINVAAGHPSRLAHLDGIRALAVLAVVAFHWNGGTIPGLFHSGYIGVDVFLVLSGYLITGILYERAQSGQRSMTEFLKSRARRLYPALVGMVLTVWLAYAIVRPQQTTLRPTWLDGLMTLGQLGWLPVIFGWAHDVAFNHTWSLGVEWVFYLVWPFILWRVIDHVRRPWIAVAVGSAVVYGIAAALLPWQWFYNAPLSRASELGIGCALALFVAERRRPGQKLLSTPAFGSGVAWVGLTVLVVWVLFVPDVSPMFRWFGLPVVTLASAALIGGSSQPSRLRSLLAARPMALIGAMSYSIYLWHVPWRTVIHDFDPGIHKLASVAVVAILTAVSSCVTFYLLERPYFRSAR